MTELPLGTTNELQPEGAGEASVRFQGASLNTESADRYPNVQYRQRQPVQVAVPRVEDRVGNHLIFLSAAEQLRTMVENYRTQLADAFTAQLQLDIDVTPPLKQSLPGEAGAFLIEMKVTLGGDVSSDQRRAARDAIYNCASQVLPENLSRVVAMKVRTE